jgi:hypothetical protein
MRSGDILHRMKADRRKLYRELLRCNMEADQRAAAVLRAAIDSISSAAELLVTEAGSPERLHLFHIHVEIPRGLFADPIFISVLLQQKGTYPLPLNHFFELCPPVGDSVFTAVIETRRDIFRFEKCFSLGDRTDANIKMMTRAYFAVKMWHLCPTTSEVHNDIVAMAATGLAPLYDRSEIAVPLRLMTLDKKLTNYRFHLRITTSHPLFCPGGLLVDQDILAFAPDGAPDSPDDASEKNARFWD